MPAGNGTGMDDDRMQVDSLKKRKGKGKGKHQNQKGICTTSTTNTSSSDINTCKNFGRTVHWAKDCTTLRPVITAKRRKARVTRKAKGTANTWTLWKRISFLKQLQPCRILDTTPSTIGELSCNSNVELWIIGVTINSVSTKRHAGAENLLLDSGAQLHACPNWYPGQKVPLPDPGIHTASGARLQHDGGRVVTHKLPEGRTIRVLFHACEVLKPILSLGCLPQHGYWSDLRADTGTLFFLDKIQTKHSQTQFAQGREVVLCERDVGCALVDSWCE